MEYRTHIQLGYPFADVRSILGIYGKEHNKSWRGYLNLTEDMYGDEIELPAQLPWGMIWKKVREDAVSRLEQLCAEKTLEWGTPFQKKALARWRMFGLQRTANKARQRGLALSRHVKSAHKNQLIIYAGHIPSSTVASASPDIRGSSSTIAFDAQTKVQDESAGKVDYARNAEPHDSVTDYSGPKTALTTDQALIDPVKNAANRPFDPSRDLN